MLKFVKTFTLLNALCCVLLAVAACAGIPDKPEDMPLTPKARNEVRPCDEPGYAGGYDPSGRSLQSGWAGWSEPEKQAATFINSAPIYFHYDSAVLTPQAQAVLRQKAERIKAFPQLRVTIAGHCDERGTDSYNYALGQRRAMAALDYLVKLGVSRDRLDTISYGKTRPVAAGQGEGAWSLNRRDEFNVTKPY